MTKAIRILGLTALVGAGMTAVGAEGLRVRAVRHWSFEQTTRVAVEVSGEFQFRSERLHNPERIFFDIRNARPAMGKGVDVTTVEDALLKRIRVAETQPGVTRVVLDVAPLVEFTASQLSNPDRLMIELRKGSAPAIPVISAAPKPPVVSTPTPAVIPPPAPANSADAPDAPKAALKPITTPLPAAAGPPPAPSVPSAPSEVAQAARRNSDGHSSLTRALGLKVTRVVIDPGHGGHDQGTVGPKGYTEKELVLDVAQRLGTLIEEKLGSEVIYTRADDTFIPLEGRTHLANEKKADLFISVHANSSPAASVRGVEVYYLNFTNMKDALDVASRENASSQKSIFELRSLIQQISMQEKLDESKEFAARVQSSLQAFERSYSPTAKNRGVKKAPFVVLIGANMPSILAEIGFLSNAREEALLRKPEHRQKLAEAMFKGISRYAQGLSHFDVARNEQERR